MRKCEYCGAQNTDEAARCAGCGTEFLVPTSLLRELDPTTPRRWVPSWLAGLVCWCFSTRLRPKLIGAAIGAALPIVVFAGLRFGPDATLLYFFMLQFFCLAPLFLVSNVFGLGLTLQTSLPLPFVWILASDSVSGFVLGSLVGWLVIRFRSRPV